MPDWNQILDFINNHSVATVLLFINTVQLFIIIGSGSIILVILRGQSRLIDEVHETNQNLREQLDQESRRITMRERDIEESNRQAAQLISNQSDIKENSDRNTKTILEALGKR